MIKVTLGILVGWLVVSCTVGSEEEQNTAGVLSVDSNSNEIEVPDWVTAADLDLNRDGTIDIKDLVIHSKFFGQDVPEADAVAAVSEEADESDPCRELRNTDYYSSLGLQIETVEDNTEFKKTFSAPNGNTYAYALIAMVKQWSRPKTGPIKNPTQSEREEYSRPSCVAIRLTIDEKLMLKEVRIKPVAGHKNMFSETIILSAEQLAPIDDSWRRFGLTARLSYTDGSAPIPQTRGWRLWLRSLDIPLPPGNPSAELKKHQEKTLKKGIPFNEQNSVLYSFFFTVMEGDYELLYYWELNDFPNPRPFMSSNRPGGAVNLVRDVGAYVKMLPSEVRRRYFPEDIE